MIFTVMFIIPFFKKGRLQSDTYEKDGKKYIP